MVCYQHFAREKIRIVIRDTLNEHGQHSMYVFGTQHTHTHTHTQRERERERERRDCFVDDVPIANGYDVRHELTPMKPTGSRYRQFRMHTNAVFLPDGSMTGSMR